MSEPHKKHHRKRKRRSHSNSSPPDVIVPMVTLALVLGLLCLLIYSLSACRWNWDSTSF